MPTWMAIAKGLLKLIKGLKGRKKGGGGNAIFLLKLAGTDKSRHAMIREMQIDPVSRQIVRTDNRGSAQLNVQVSWLRREPWSTGEGPDAARAFLFFGQRRYNLP